MAILLPNNPAGAYPPETLRVFRLLKQLPDSFTVWQRLTPDAPAGPAFWVRHATGGSALISVANVPLSAIRAARQADLFGAAAPPGAAEEAALAAFVAAQGLADADQAPRLPALMLYPNAPHSELALALDPPPPGVIRGAREDLNPEGFADWLTAELSPPLSPTDETALRHAFTPEVVVPARLTARMPIRRAVDAELTDYLLSYNQEWVLKHDLDLTPEAEAAAEDVRLQLVHGVAGSGKSLILLYRARLLRQFFPRKRILALTHNRPLIRDLQRRYRLLTNGDNSVEWRTFQGWCRAYWPPNEPSPTMISQHDRRDLIERIWQQRLADTALSPELLQSEIEWLKDRLITTRQGYLEADRSGRGFALRESVRERVYDAIHAYQAALQERARLDFGDVPRRIWRAMIDADAPFPTYDVILIDEAQFFAPIWFEIIKRILTPNHGQLFMVADPTQGFLKRRQSWLASGLNVRGHTRQLAVCYRTTRAILSFATRFYQLRLPDDDEALIGADLHQTAEGLPPELITLTSEQDELARTMNEIKALTAQGVPLEHILIIHADWQGAARVLERLQAEFGVAHAIHPRHAATRPEQIRVCQLDAVTGLESPIVFLLGAHKLIEAEGSLRLSEEERIERVRDTTRRLYMAMTRAGQRLVLTYVGAPPGWLQPSSDHAPQTNQAPSGRRS
jgi:hypothetical protein